MNTGIDIRAALVMTERAERSNENKNGYRETK